MAFFLSPARLAGRLLPALFAAAISTASAQDLRVPYAGTWSRTFDTCSLSDDEDETRLRITAGSLENDRETCAISNPRLQEDGSYGAGLSCGVSGRGVLRVYLRDLDRAVFFTAVGRRGRSRDGVRCPPELPRPDALVEAGETSTASKKGGRPKVTPKEWLKYRQLCSVPSSPDREDACAERRRIGRVLRSQGLCHVTRGNREGWRACGARGG